MYELLIIWQDGVHDSYAYDTKEEAECDAKDMKETYGDEIQETRIKTR